MKDLEFLAEVINEVSNGDHHLDTNPDMDPVTVGLRHGCVGLDGNTTTELWNSYKELTGEKQLTLKLT